MTVPPAPSPVLSNLIPLPSSIFFLTLSSALWGTSDAGAGSHILPPEQEFSKSNEKIVIKGSRTNRNLFDKFSILKNKNLNQIIKAQRDATKIVFKRKKIPFRSFEILDRNEDTLGELFTFFVLETILLGRLMKVNPFDQPSVELIKTETSKLLI